ncbi:MULTISPECIES: ATP-grasp domain-containing protein [unclassified Halomonas]|uniref:ATP-grasp domain-containing protein n=1 Tax=unclassified Halomonas TaxID=2609666 RepID=UPI0020A08B6B|nr:MULTISPECIES: ATP-grasp domain-containing protein [unclassified Halomonas]MCP1314516.1 ATP-grasp domain-containing protein [Halomonas sp. 707D7]MCP1325339.1 ATP-grasp domain-containing protein [Halomonas sp. 707D4]
MNVLITSFGSFSASCLASSLKKNFHAKIVATDINDQLHLAGTEHINLFERAPHSSDTTRYLDFIASVIKRHDIDYVLPTTDPEIDILSLHDEFIQNTKSTFCIPGREAVLQSRDKKNWAQTLKDKGFVTIPTFEQEDIASMTSAVIAKPRNGRSSQGLLIIQDPETRLSVSHSKRYENYVFQPFILGKHYVVDAVRDLYGNCITVCREEITRTSSGAGLAVTVAYNEELEQITERIMNELNIHGAINIEYLESDGIYYAMDINPRPSAGIEFSVLSGIDIPKYHLQCFQHKEIPHRLDYSSKTYKTIYQRVVS